MQFPGDGSSIALDELFAKTEIFGQTRFLNFAQGLLEFFSLMEIFRQNQKIGADCIQCSGQIFCRQTKSGVFGIDTVAPEF